MPSAASNAGGAASLVAWQAGLWRLSGGAFADVVAGVGDRTVTLEALRKRPECAQGLVHAEQVHGASLAAIETLPPPSHPIGRNTACVGTPVAHPADGGVPGSVAGCDALMTSRAQLALVIRTADCLPLYVWDAAKRVIGLAHVGWRGLAKQLPMRVAGALRQWYHSRLEDLWWGIGPAIRACCYEVGEEFEPRFGHFVHTTREGRRVCDLPGATIEQLQRCGMRTAQLIDTGVCTACDRAGTILAGDRAGSVTAGEEVSAADGRPTEEVPRTAGGAADQGRWFSVRREGDATGRFFSFIAMEGL